MCTRATAPLCVYPCFCYRSCRRRSCQCGLHKQAARAKVARSSAQPKGLRSASRRQSRRSCSASRPGRRARSRPHRTARRSPVRLAPRSGSPAGGSASAAPGASVPLSPSAPLQARSGLRPPRSFRGLRKPRSGSCSAGGGDEREERQKFSWQLSGRRARATTISNEGREDRRHHGTLRQAIQGIGRPLRQVHVRLAEKVSRGGAGRRARED